MIDDTLAEVMEKLADVNIQGVLTANHLVVKRKYFDRYWCE